MAVNGLGAFLGRGFNVNSLTNLKRILLGGEGVLLPFPCLSLGAELLKNWEGVIRIFRTTIRGRANQHCSLYRFYWKWNVRVRHGARKYLLLSLHAEHADVARPEQSDPLLCGRCRDQIKLAESAQENKSQ